MNIESMKLFIAVYESNSFSLSAAQLYMSHQAVSKRIKGIERELNAQLFERSSKGIQPTLLGEKAYNTFKGIVKAYQELQGSIEKSYERETIIKLAIELYDVDNINHESLIAFESACSSPIHLSIEYHTNADCFKRLENKQTDICIMQKPLVDRGNFEFYSLGVSRSCVVVSTKNPLAKKKMIRIEDLENQTFLNIVDAEATEVFNQLFAQKNIFVKSKTIAYDIKSLISLIKTNRGFHVIPEIMLWQLSTEPDIAAIPFPEGDYIFDLGLTWPKGQKNKPAVQEFIDYVKQNAAHITR